MTTTPNQAPRSEGRWWDLAVAAVIVFVTIMVVVDGVAGGPRWAASLDLWWRIAILVTPNVLLAALYLGLGRDVILRSANGQRLSPRGIAFVALLVLVVFIGAICDPTYATLQVVVYPVIWNVAPNYRDAVAWCFAVAASVGVGMYIGLVADGVDAALFQSFVTALVSLVFSLAMGTWILRIHARGETYRELAEELRLSQDEVAALSKAAGASAERERMSRDLHDTLTQTLTGLVMLSEQAERALDAGDQERVRVASGGLGRRHGRPLLRRAPSSRRRNPLATTGLRTPLRESRLLCGPTQTCALSVRLSLCSCRANTRSCCCARCRRASRTPASMPRLSD